MFLPTTQLSGNDFEAATSGAPGSASGGSENISGSSAFNLTCNAALFFIIGTFEPSDSATRMC